MDSANYVTLMLMDKGYYDYDYERVAKKKVLDVAPRSKEDTAKLVARFGVGGAAKQKAEELQKIAMDSEAT